MTELTLGEFSNVLNYLIDNNKRLIDNGDTPIAVCLEAEAGLGKTSVMQQIAEAKGMTFAKIVLSQLEEPSELVGFPYKEYKVTHKSEEKWMSADLLQYLNCEDYQFTNESRMSYAVPAWLPQDGNPNGCILCLDDFSRANSLLMQAVMEIINTGSYVSWKLPKYTTILLTSNPDNGSYNVVSLDNAVKTRMLTFHGKFDIKEWAHWAENFGIDGRAINFAMYYATEIFEEKNGVVLANARSYTTFCRAIGGVTDWSNEDSLAFILEISSGCFLGKDNILGGLFTSFINNKLDKLISPEELLTGSWETVSKKMKDCVYHGDNYRADIGNILGTRFLNYSDKYITNDATAKKVGERLNEFITSDVQLLTQDILYNVIKVLCSHHSRETNSWFMNKNLRGVVL